MMNSNIIVSVYCICEMEISPDSYPAISQKFSGEGTVDLDIQNNHTTIVQCVTTQFRVLF